MNIYMKAVRRGGREACGESWCKLIVLCVGPIHASGCSTQNEPMEPTPVPYARSATYVPYVMLGQSRERAFSLV